MKLACFAGSIEPATVEVTSKRAPLTPSIKSVRTAFCLFLCIFIFARLNGVSFRCSFELLFAFPAYARYLAPSTGEVFIATRTGLKMAIFTVTKATAAISTA